MMRIRTGTSAQADGTCCRTDSCKSAVHFMRLPGHAAEYTNDHTITHLIPDMLYPYRKPE